MTDLFLDPKVLNYSADRYELILLTLRWARQLKARGSPEPMMELIEKALKDLVEQRVTKEEIVANKAVAEVPPRAAEVPAPSPALEAVEEKAAETAKAGANGAEKKTKTKKKKK